MFFKKDPAPTARNIKSALENLGIALETDIRYNAEKQTNKTLCAVYKHKQECRIQPAQYTLAHRNSSTPLIAINTREEDAIEDIGKQLTSTKEGALHLMVPRENDLGFDIHEIQFSKDSGLTLKKTGLFNENGYHATPYTITFLPEKPHIADCFCRAGLFSAKPPEYIREKIPTLFALLNASPADSLKIERIGSNGQFQFSFEVASLGEADIDALQKELTDGALQSFTHTIPDTNTAMLFYKQKLPQTITIDPNIGISL